jgi:putative FmdB family regulatory protein
MPFYEYECSSCKFYTEVMQKITDAPLTKCPSCGKKAMVKLVSAPNFRLKGGGWYETDFKGDKENKRNLAGGDDEAPSAPETKAETSTEASKAETSTEASKAEPAKAEGEKPVTVAKTPSVSTAPKAKPKPSAPRVSAAGRSAKPVPRAAPARAAAAKAKPAPARKKARR